MISYNLNCFNNLSNKIFKIFEKNNISTNDPEIIVPLKIIEEIENLIDSCCSIPINRFLKEKCPKCGKKHLNFFPSKYSRNVIFKIGNILVKIKILVPRLICNNCNSTHAILPDFCVPLKRYSKQAILEISSMALKNSTQETADTLNLEAKQVRRFVNILKKQKDKLKFISSKLSKSRNLYILIKRLPKNINEIYFKNFKQMFLYECSKRYLYLKYIKLSI